ncbi:nucleotidyltransferase [Lactobacillus sp. Sy-1]|uniref:nucleotidyltransferase n=1 Tax=Lactobacillus sp. Sy-1 TaxID=2109645 RepID=UPI001C55DBC4|nr:nucleotidyltransferase [Lactobacillus sp. Sy-1]MBW1605687.1 nucleotidyltransferase [Lactobacillus sp. Sy-1]
MLSAVGIIAEYNPFHNGHQYQLKVAKQRSNADVVVAVMSGNWVQRGAPAIVDKWQRTEMALAGGVDLVVELPVFSAVQPADRFAMGAVAIINQLRCQSLAFGCEHPEWDFAKLAVGQLTSDNEHFRDYHRPYPDLIQAALKNQLGVSIDQPNDILAWNYARARHAINGSFSLIPIQRIGSQHHDHFATNAFASASSIRAALFAQHWAQVREMLPPTSYQLLQNPMEWLDWDCFWPQLRYQLITTPLTVLRERYQMTEGIEHRLKAAAIKANSFDQFINIVKTKRYTFARIQRLLVVTLLQFNSNVMVDHSPYIRILGFNNVGRQYLKQVKKQIQWPIISKIDQSMLKSQLQAEFNAGMLIQMQTGHFEDLYRHPIIKK